LKLWAGLVKVRTSTQTSEFGSILYPKKSLWLQLQKSWDNISVEVLRKYRCAAVFTAKGGHTKYKKLSL